MTCQEIHGNGCDTPIQPGWTFCPMCGSRCGAVIVRNRTLTLKAKRGGKIDPYGLQHRGQSPVSVSATLVSSPLEVEPQRLVVAAQPRAIMTFRWKTNPSTSASGGLLRLESNDGGIWDGPSREEVNPRKLWNVKARLRSQPIPVRIQLPRPAQLEIETQIVCFRFPNQIQRTLRIRNGGDEPLSVLTPHPPAGYRLVNMGAGEEISVAPRSTQAFDFQMTTNAPDGASLCEIVAFDAVGEVQTGHARLFRWPRPQTQTVTAYVVGIDFGTSGTSLIWRRNERNVQGHFISHGGKQRFTTAIYVRAVRQAETGYYRNEEGFFIGEEAVIEYQRTPSPQSGFFVQEIKSELRHSEDRLLAKYGPNYSRPVLLRRYLEKLREIVEIQLGAEHSISWCFSLPVLDRREGLDGPMFSRQRQRMAEAITDAGFLSPESGNTLDFFTEPFCAAVYLLQGHGKYQFPSGRRPRTGDWLCVFDSGGGTTDVVLGKVKDEEGTLSLEETATLGGVIDTHTHSIDLPVTTFGGQRVTENLMAALAVHRQVVRTLNLTSEKEISEMEAGAKRYRDSEGREDSRWHHDNRRLLEESEKLKLEANQTDLPNQQVKFGLKEAKLNIEPYITRREMEEGCVMPSMDDLTQEMAHHIFPSEEVPRPEKVEWVFLVGGNTRLRAVQNHLREYFGHKELPQLSEEDRMLAVAGGTIWAIDARRKNAVPYDLKVERVDDDGIAIEEVSRIAAGEVFNSEGNLRRRTLEGEAGQNANFSASVRIGEEFERVGYFSIPFLIAQEAQDAVRVELWPRFQGQMVLFFSNATGNEQEVWRYEF